MPVIFETEKKIFTIHTDRSTYQMQIGRYGHLLHLYYGKRSEGCADFLLTYADRGYSGNPFDAGEDRTYSLDSLPQEFPVQGNGDYRDPLLVIRDRNGTYGCDLRYLSHEILPGKYALEGLPAVYSGSANDDVETLKIVLINRRTGTEVTLLYGVLPHLDILTRAALVRNGGTGRITVERLGSACLDFLSGEYDLITFHGRHCMERQPERRKIPHGELTVGSRRGFSSHQFNPMLVVTDPETNETSGRCWSMQFVWSGGFRASAGLDQYGQTRVLMGLADEKFSYPLQPGESLTAPEVILSFSSSGLETLSHNLHACIRGHVCRGSFRDIRRPLLLNSWEASYFGFTGDTIVSLVKEAKELGIEMLVMDDGWFGKRDDDKSGLGDWHANEKKLGCSLKELIRRVNAENVRFGIWVEPEMVSEDSDLYRSHPDWALAIPGEGPVRSRSQLVLDLSRREVADAVCESVLHILDEGNIEYLKWDCNRSIAEAYSHTADDQGKVLYEYMKGLYRILERILQRYPDLLIEGCCGGGGRFDAGMLYYTPQIWCSDNTDALDRLRIQYGTSFGYPCSAVGAHVSACPNHQTGRSISLNTRGIVAMSGTFGYELDPSKLREEEKEEIRKQIREYRKYEELVRTGRYYRLSDPAKDPVSAWQFLSPDGSEALVCAVLTQNHGNPLPAYIKPRGLAAGAFYTESASGKIYSADILTDSGFPLPFPSSDGEAFLFHFLQKE